MATSRGKDTFIIDNILLFMIEKRLKDQGKRINIKFL